MSRITEDKFKDVAVWYKEHKAECNDHEKRVVFNERAMDHLLWLMTYMLEDIQRLEGASRTSVLLPPGVLLNQPPRRT